MPLGYAMAPPDFGRGGALDYYLRKFRPSYVLAMDRMTWLIHEQAVVHD